MKNTIVYVLVGVAVLYAWFSSRTAQPQTQAWFPGGQSPLQANTNTAPLGAPLAGPPFFIPPSQTTGQWPPAVMSPDVKQVWPNAPFDPSLMGSVTTTIDPTTGQPIGVSGDAPPDPASGGWPIDPATGLIDYSGSTNPPPNTIFINGRQEGSPGAY